MHITLPIVHLQQVASLGVAVPTERIEGADRNDFSFDIRELKPKTLDDLYKYLQGFPELRSVRTQINAYKRATESAEGAVEGKFRVMAGVLSAYLVKDAIKGWIFKMGTYPVAGLVTDVEYYPPVKKRDYEREAYIEISYCYKAKGRINHGRAQANESQGDGCTAAQLLQVMGWQKETLELHEDYERELKRYAEMAPMYGKQLKLLASHVVSLDSEEDDNRYYGYRYRQRHQRNSQKIDLVTDNAGRVVHDDLQEEGKAGVSRYGRSDTYDDEDSYWTSTGLMVMAEREKKDGKVFKLGMPYDMHLKVYHLGRHQNIEVHSQDLEPYQYDKDIRSKLVLEPMYREVLDVMTADMKLIQEDVIAGKAGGNVILLSGPPGLGKTLAAEVYAEERQVPLLKIHSGQLGTDPDTIEKRVLEFYSRASKWGAPILLDEFDVFGRKRGDNLIQNAVVAVFLRTLEYQKNTIFMTTNRADDMDDAILSRCLAILRFDFPEYDELHQIWKVLKLQYLPELPEDVIDEVMEYFKKHGKKMSGRDVKQILQLGARYRDSGRALDKKTIMNCAAFRGV